LLIELWRKVLATDYSGTCCGVCGNDFRVGSVFPVAFTDRRESLGEVCPVCLGYLNRRKEDEDDPTLGNWPACEWPTPDDLEEARGRYPGAMFPDSDAYDAAAPDWDAQQEVAASATVWKMQREARG
jgi:hypothetical protein